MRLAKLFHYGAELGRINPRVTNQRRLDGGEEFPQLHRCHQAPRHHRLGIGDVALVAALQLGQRLTVEVVVKELDRPL